MNQNVKSHLVNFWGKILLIYTFLNTNDHQGSQEKGPTIFLKAKPKNLTPLYKKKYFAFSGQFGLFTSKDYI